MDWSCLIWVCRVRLQSRGSPAPWVSRAWCRGGGLVAEEGHKLVLGSSAGPVPSPWGLHKAKPEPQGWARGSLCPAGWASRGESVLSQILGPRWAGGWAVVSPTSWGSDWGRALWKLLYPGVPRGQPGRSRHPMQIGCPLGRSFEIKGALCRHLSVSSVWCFCASLSKIISYCSAVPFVFLWMSCTWVNRRWKEQEFVFHTEGFLGLCSDLSYKNANAF